MVHTARLLLKVWVKSPVSCVSGLISRVADEREVWIHENKVLLVPYTVSIFRVPLDTTYGTKSSVYEVFEHSVPELTNVT